MKLSFVELGVRNLGESLRWYEFALRFAVELLDESNGFALLNDGGGGRLALKQGSPGFARLQFEVANLNDELARLDALGILPIGDIKTSTEGYRRAKFRDPDGYAIALFEWLKCV